GALRADASPHSARHATHASFGGSDGGRLRSRLSLRRPRAQDPPARAPGRDRARGSGAVERPRSRPLAHLSRDEAAAAPRRAHVARAPSPASANAAAGPTRAAGALLRAGLDSRMLPRPSFGGPQRSHRWIHGAPGISSRDRTGAHSIDEPRWGPRGGDG